MYVAARILDYNNDYFKKDSTWHCIKPILFTNEVKKEKENMRDLLFDVIK